jgi:formylglycine-generating enzyme required for sulfatase activity
VRRAVAAAIVVAATGGAVAFGVARQGEDEGARCGAGFVARGARCVVAGAGSGACPAPLVATAGGCDAPDVRVLVPAAAVAVGPSDWEAEGRVLPRSIRVQAFRIDAFEVTQGRWRAGAGAASEDVGRSPQGAAANLEVARAASGMTLAEAAAFCQGHGGRLPTEDEWIVAALSAMNPPRRYPWGDTGAVCRRAAWGLKDGPCARGADGPDTVGAHPDGNSPLGIHDLAGNVAEWVSDDTASAPPVLGPGPQNTNLGRTPQNTNLGRTGAAKGGSWSSALAADLRVWATLELPPEARDPRVGLRCVYPP